MTSNATNGSASYTVPFYIDGKETTSSVTFPVVSPSTGETLWQASSASTKDALAAIEAAAKAFPSWSKTKPPFRRNILFKAADLLEKREKECIDYMMQETGAVEPFGKFNLATTAEMLRDVGGRIEAVLHGEVPVCADDNTQSMVLKEPYGVVLGIAPWNAPYILGVRSILYAIAVGNTAVMKGSELSPRCFSLLVQVMNEAGLPPGVVNLIYAQPKDAAEVTTALIEHPAIRKVNFTGSTAVGSIIASTAGKNLKPVLMELGGKASAIVCDDADISKAAFQCALGAFMHSGQICMSTERILVASSILDKFRPALQEKIGQIFPSHTPAVLVQSAGVEKNKRLIADAVSKGAKVIHGDYEKEEISKTRMAPVVVEGTTKEMDLFHTESFGPSVSVIPFEKDEDAIAIANDTDYGLNGAVFTENLVRGLKIARAVDTGNIHINSMTVHDEAALPHGGVKRSGWGRFNGRWGLDEFLRLKTITYQI